ncbi:MAG TPA: hypothetical protein VEA60_00745 [Allosphingosinicella sp.]|nr:hypothetical protein [Allosphingosinicella sp.]
MHHSNKGNWRSKKTILKVAAFATAAGLIATPVAAVHSWNGYHWARTSTQISPPVISITSSTWDSYVRTAVADWNRSTVIESGLTETTGNSRTCKPQAGTILVCNAAYGQTGWLGIASIWLSGGHIAQGTTKLNDTYYASATYNTPAWRAAVTCQEIGHDYGLGHQDEDFSTDATSSCMEYTSVPAGNEHPDQHDYDQLLSIYNHVDSAAAAAPSRNLPSQAPIGNTRADWGRQIGDHTFERDLGNGVKVITDVLFVGHRH